MILIKSILVVVSALLVGAALGFVALNFMTGCESWDREQWTATHSCVLPSDPWRKDQ